VVHLVPLLDTAIGCPTDDEIEHCGTFRRFIPAPGIRWARFHHAGWQCFAHREEPPVCRGGLGQGDLGELPRRGARLGPRGERGRQLRADWRRRACRGC
jgi:hypothetical protein